MNQAQIEFLVKGRNEAQGTFAELNRDTKAAKENAEATSAAFKQFGSSSTKSVGELTSAVDAARKQIADLRKEALSEGAAGRSGVVAGISAQLDEAIPKLKKLEDELRVATKVPAESLTSIERFQASLKGLADAEARLTVEQKAQVQELLKYTSSIEKIAQATGGGKDAIQKYVQGLRDEERQTAQATKAHEREVAALNAAKSSMKDLSSAQLQMNRNYIDEGKSVSDTARLVGVHQQQVSQVVKADKEAAAASTSWSQALGGVSGILTTIGITVSAGALIGFGKQIMDDVGHLNDLAGAAGLTVAEMQRFQYVGAGAGLTADDMGNAVMTLSKRLANGDQSATSAVMALGLSVQQLQALGPKETFIQVGEAVSRVVDPMERNGIAAELFGDKISRKLLPALGDLRSQLQQVPESTLLTKEEADAIDQVGDAWERAKLSLEGYLAKKAVSFFKPTREENDRMGGTEYANSIAIAGVEDRVLPNMSGPEPAGAARFENMLKGWKDAAKALTDEQKAQIRTALQYTDSVSQIAQAVKGGEDAVRKYIEGVKESGRAASQSEKAHNREAEALRAANSSMHDLSGAQVEAIRYYEAQHKSASDIAKILEVYPQQVSEVIAADKDAADSKKLLQKASEGVFAAVGAAQKKANAQMKQDLKEEGANYKAAVDAYDRYADAVSVSDEAKTRLQIQRIHEWAERELAALDKTKAGYAEAAAAIKATEEQLTNDYLTQLEIRSQALASQFVGPTLEQAGKVHKDFENLKASILDMGDAFAALAGDSDSAFDRIARGVGNVISAMQQGQRAAEGIAGGWKQFGAGGAKNMLAGGAQMAAGLFDGYRAMQQATSGESRWGNVAGGAATGAQIGSNFGPWGTLIGGGIGALWGAFSNPEKKVNKTRQEYIDAAGGLDELNKKAFAATGSLDAVRKLLAAKNTKQFEDAVKGLTGALDEFDKMASEASSKFGPSKTELKEAEKHAHDLYDYVAKQAEKGEYTAEQVDRAYYEWQQAMAAAGDEAAAAWIKAHDAAAGGAEQTSAAFNALQQQWNDLAKSVENEAPEPDMGSTERATREQMDRIKAQMDAMNQAQTETAEQTAQTTAETWGETADGSAEKWKTAGEDWTRFLEEKNARAADKMGLDLEAAGKAGADGIRKAFDGLELTARVRYEYESPNPNPGPEGAAAGGIYATGARGVATWFGEGGQPEVGGPASFFERIFTKLGVVGDQVGATRNPVPQMNLTVHVSGVLSEGDLVQTVRSQIAPIIYAAWRDNIEGHNSLANSALQGQ